MASAGRAGAFATRQSGLLDEAGWRKAADNGPAGRQLGAMAFDEARGHAILFGGADATRRKLDDTWAWDGARWSLLAEAGPGPRTSHGMSWHPGLRRAVLLGGNGATAKGDSWAWDGGGWTPFAPDGPPLFHFASGYDPDREALIVFGGFGQSGRVGDTWLVTAAGWERQTIGQAPPLRAEHDGAAVPGIGFFIFGGIGGQGMGEAERAAALLNDAWAWRAGGWRRAD
ncbi:MAG TPA: hypothetical protein VFF48_11190 [Brevundimonas sp.]|nr:hypothetical protein [Brevundimonas sp.]